MLICSRFFFSLTKTRHHSSSQLGRFHSKNKQTICLTSTLFNQNIHYNQEYPTEPLDRIPALQADFELTGKKHIG